MSVLRNRPKGARVRVLRPRSLHLRIDADRDRLSGHRLAAGAAARRRRTLAEAGVLRRRRTIQLATYSFGRPIGTSSPQSATLSAGEPRQSGHRHHRLGDAQSAGAGAAALSGLRFPQGRPHAEGRSPRQRHAAQTAERRADGSAAPEDPVDLERLGDGREDRRRCQPSRARAARSRTCGSAEARRRCRNIDAVACRSRAQPLDDSKARRRACRRCVEPAPPRDGFSVKTASLFFGSSSLGAAVESMERWQPGEEPMIVMPRVPIPT